MRRASHSNNVNSGSYGSAPPFLSPIGGKSPSGAGAVKRMSEMNFSDCKRMPWKPSCPAQARQEILRKSMNFSGSSHGYRSHLWTVQEDRKSLEWCHGLTVFFPFTTDAPFGKCFRAPRLLAAGRCAALRLFLFSVVGLAVK